MGNPAPLRKRIFIVEDDAHSADFLRTLLGEENFEAVAWQSAEEALASLRAGGRADLILLDIMLEGMDGYEFCRLVKSDLKLRFIPIIIISGKSSVEEKVLGLKLGADDFLVKPFKNKELLAKIHVLLRIKDLQDQLVHAEKLAGIGQLAAGVAHEFNNLIGGMLGYAQLGMMNLDDQAMVAKAFQIIENSCFRAKELTENMLLFSSNQIRTESSSSLTHAVDHCLILLSAQLEKSGVAVSKDLTHRSRVAIEANRLLQVFVNLVQNAIYAIAKKELPNPRRITIHTSEVGETVRVEFTDSGIGIPEEYHDKIFEPFFTTKGALGGGDSAGMGMGLSVVYGIVSAHDGAIQLLSSSHEGTTFRLHLPTDRSGAGEEAAERVESPAHEDDRIDAAVLVVDDEKIYGDLLSDALVKYGARVTLAVSGEQAIERCLNDRYDIVFMDYLMPGIGGIEAARKIKGLGADIPIVFMTGRAIIENLRESIDLPDPHFLAKPFNVRELVGLARQLLPRAGAAPHA